MAGQLLAEEGINAGVISLAFAETFGRNGHSRMLRVVPQP